MPRLADPAGLAARPEIVALGELALAAGLLGDSLTVACDSSVDVLCRLWQFFARTLGAENIAHVVSASDIKQVRKQLTQVRAVFVRSPRLHLEVAWMIQMAWADSTGTRPALFCGADVDPEFFPGTALLLSVDERENAALLKWAESEGQQHATDVEIPSAVGCDCQLTAVLRQIGSNAAALGHRELRTLQSLVAGASLLRSSLEDGNERGVEMTLADYSLVRELLSSRTVRPNREACNPLTLDMIRRANVYLAVKYGNDRESPLRVEESGRYRSRDRIPRDVITRRELADLGNIRSRLVTTLIEYLQGAEAGYARYREMGCLGVPTPETSWRRLPARVLARGLTAWSAKQVRTHFDRLRHRGLVQAERYPTNGPLCIRIPEEFETSGSPYSGLPTVRA
ncbi:MAG: hypothetical protein RIC55_24685 [Pirellulaceae bacterium]